MLRYAGKRLKRAHRWEPDLSTVEWAERNIYLNPDASPMTGMVRFNDTPHIRKTLDIFDRPHVWKVLLNWSTQTGKALDISTPLLTTDGWTTMGELRVGDKLFDENGKPCTVTYKSPLYHIDTYDVVFNTGETIRASKDHIWTVNERLKDGKIISRDLTTLGMLNAKILYSNTRPKFSIPFTKPLQFEEVELPIPPYTLGAWLGDGNANSPYLTCHSDDTETLDNIKNEGVYTRFVSADKRRPKVEKWAIGTRKKGCCVAGHDTTLPNSTYPNTSCKECARLGYPSRKPLFIESVRKIGLYKNKHIPEIYLRASYAQRLSLLQGLMDTDGHISKSQCEFVTSIPALAEGFRELITGFGLRFSMKVKKTTHKDVYRFTFTAYSDLHPVFRMKRKAERQKPSKTTDAARVRQVRERYIVAINRVNTVPTQCITVDSQSHLFLAGKGLIPTHNTFSLQVAWAKAMSTDPCRMQWSIKNKNDLNDYLDEKVKPFLRGVKTLNDRVKELSDDTKKKERATSINVLTGGTTFTGTTDAERRSKSVKYIFMDEIALYGKGHFVELEGRTKAFERYHRKVLACSSRKHEGDEMDTNFSTCEAIYEWQTWCPHCEGYFYAESKHFKFLRRSEWKVRQGIDESAFVLSEYRDEALRDVHIECPHCAGHIHDDVKAENILQDKYKLILVDGREDGETVGIKANALAVRITSFKTIASLWINAENEDDPDVIGQFFIDYFNEFYEGNVADKVEANELLALGNGLSRLTVPDDTYKLYMGVDTQKDHFWVEIKAFCYGRVSHSIYSARVETFADVEDLWLIGQNLKDQHGGQWMVSKMGIDRRGYNDDGVRRTDEVDAFVEYMVSKYRNGDDDRIYATEGHTTLTGDKAIQVVSSRDLSNNRRKVDIKILKMNGLYLKNILQRSIDRSLKAVNAVEGEEGWGWTANRFFINQDEVELDRNGTVSTSYTRQLTAEVYDYARNPKNGTVDKVKTWIRVSKDNHLWDTSVICEAFAEMDKVALAVKPTQVDYKSAIAGLIS